MGMNLTFSAYKSPGEDGIYPALQEGLKTITGPVMIFRACIALGCVPLSWRVVRVIFIPKPGRPRYVQAKSFRPIGLTAFVLKTLKRLLGR
jgi:hypothetical protein